MSAITTERRTVLPVRRTRPDPVVVAVVIIAASASALTWLRTDPSPGITPDSVAYWDAASNLMAGDGLRISYAFSEQVLSHFPPGYSLVLAGVGSISNLSFAASAVNALSVGLGAALIAGISRLIVGRWTWIAAGTALLFSVSDQTLAVYGMLWSEPLFVALMLIHMAALVVAVRDNNIGWTVAAGAAGATAASVRYVGAAFALSSFVILWRSGMRVHAFITAGLVGFGTMISLLIGKSSRTIAWLPLRWQDVIDLSETAGSWVAPVVPMAGLMIAVLAAAWLILDRKDAVRSERAPRVVGITAGALLIVLLVSRLFVYDSIPFNFRLLFPFQVLTLVAFASYAPRRQRVAVPVVCLVLVLSLQVWGLASEPLYQTWRFVDLSDHPAMTLAEEAPSDIRVWSNVPREVYFFAGRPSDWVPPTQHSDGSPVATFSESLEPLLDGAIVYRLGALTERFPSVETLTNYGFVVIEEREDAVLLTGPEVSAADMEPGPSSSSQD